MRWECSLLASAHSVSAVRFSSPFSSFLVTLNWILAQQTSLCALSTSAPFSNLFILLHCLIWSTPTILTFSALLKLGSNPLPLNFRTVPLHTTHWSALPVIAPTSSRPLAVAQLSSSANLSRNYPLLFFIVRVIFCYSATFSFKIISLQYLLSSTFVHLLKTILCFPRWLQFLSVLCCNHSPWIYHHQWL